MSEESMDKKMGMKPDMMADKKDKGDKKDKKAKALKAKKKKGC